MCLCDRAALSLLVLEEMYYMLPQLSAKISLLLPSLDIFWLTALKFGLGSSSIFGRYHPLAQSQL